MTKVVPKTAPLIINLAPTGMVPTRAISAHVPLTPKEIVKDVLRAAELGVTIAHLHARSAEGFPSCDRKIYAQIIEGIRTHRSDLLICVSCSGRSHITFAERSDVLQLTGDLKPDMASLTPSSINFSQQASINSPDMILRLIETMHDKGICPEFEIFDLGMANYMAYLISKLGCKPPHYANLIFGNIASAQSDLLSISAVISALPEGTFYSLGGTGRTQRSMTALGAIVADGVRTGLEDNLWLDQNGTSCATNEQLVQRAIGFADMNGRGVMTPLELRQMLRLDTF